MCPTLAGRQGLGCSRQGWLCPGRPVLTVPASAVRGSGPSPASHLLLACPLRGRAPGFHSPLEQLGRKADLSPDRGWEGMGLWTRRGLAVSLLPGQMPWKLLPAALLEVGAGILQGEAELRGLPPRPGSLCRPCGIVGATLQVWSFLWRFPRKEEGGGAGDSTAS